MKASYSFPLAVDKDLCSSLSRQNNHCSFEAESQNFLISSSLFPQHSKCVPHAFFTKVGPSIMKSCIAGSSPASVLRHIMLMIEGPPATTLFLFRVIPRVLYKPNIYAIFQYNEQSILHHSRLAYKECGDSIKNKMPYKYFSLPAYVLFFTGKCYAIPTMALVTEGNKVCI